MFYNLPTFLFFNNCEKSRYRHDLDCIILKDSVGIAVPNLTHPTVYLDRFMARDSVLNFKISQMPRLLYGEKLSSGRALLNFVSPECLDCFTAWDSVENSTTQCLIPQMLRLLYGEGLSQEYAKSVLQCSKSSILFSNYLALTQGMNWGTSKPSLDKPLGHSQSRRRRESNRDRRLQ